MTPLEFLYRLTTCPEDSRLNLVHAGLVFDMLSAVLIVKPGSNGEVSRIDRLTSEAEFAKWLGVPVSTVHAWRAPQSGDSRMYSLGPIVDWIKQHLHPVLSDPTANLDELTVDSEFINACWKSKIAAVLIDGQFEGFFPSLNEDAEPVDYELIEDGTLALQPIEMTRKTLVNIKSSITALQKYSKSVAKFPLEAREIYDQQKLIAMPDILLQFFKQALIYDYNLAKDIAEDIGREHIGKKFNVTAWFIGVRLEEKFCKLKEGMLRDAFELLVQYGGNLNQNYSFEGASHIEVINGTTAHSMADCSGKVFKLPSIAECRNVYGDLLYALLDLGLNPEKQNMHQRTPLEIAEENETLGGENLYKHFVGMHILNKNLQASLNKK